MGCITTKTVISENPNRFDVIFADTEQTIYFNAQLEINGSDIILYRKNKPPLSWPLGSLRRYGFDANFFTFESGRRCETGEGIFSFKCQRADVLFLTLQGYINGRAYNIDNTDDFISGIPAPNTTTRSIAQLNSLNLNGTLHTSTQGSSYIVNARPTSSLSPIGTNSIQSENLATDYLEPNPSRISATNSSRMSTNMRLSSFGSGGPLSPASPSSPNSYTNILEITSFNTSQQQSHGNIYQEYPSTSLQRPSRLSLDVAPQQLAPSANQDIKTNQSMNVYMNADLNRVEKSEELKPKAKLAQMESLEVEPEILSPDSVNETSATYMNLMIGGGDFKSQQSIESTKENIQPPMVTTTPPALSNNLDSKNNDIKKDYTKDFVSGNIFGFNRKKSFSQDTARCYENLEFNFSETKPLMIRNRFSRPEIFSKVDLPHLDRNDKSEPCTPTQRKIVNYIILDLDRNDVSNDLVESTPAVSTNNNESNSEESENLTNQTGLMQPESPKKLGYATIDFNRSTALSNILSNNTLFDSDQSSRKTRHDSNVTLLMKHSNSMSD